MKALILAAGLGSRFGGDKQLAVLGPDQRPLMHYNLMDAYAAGVRHVVLILRRELVDVVARDFLPHIPRDVEVDLAIQAVDELPAGCALRQRQKPWGTGHALWCARGKLSGPFITVNADDYYGAGAIHTLAAHFLREVDRLTSSMHVGPTRKLVGRVGDRGGTLPPADRFPRKR